MQDLSKIENEEDFMNRPSDIRNYETFKKEFDEEIHRAADSYVRIGYLLIEARDTGILEGSGYATMSDFAKEEYGLSPDQTSRFIAVCEKFGDGEGHLKTEYEEFGQTKLIEMLSLPESVTESISPELTREEIRDIKNEVKEEQKITPLEVAMEPASMPDNFDNLEKFVWIYLEEHPETYLRLAEEIGKASPGEGTEKDIILKVLAPTGIAVLPARIPRMGRLLLSFTGADTKPALVFVRDDRREELDWDTLYETFENRVSSEETGEDDPKERWSKTYGKEFPIIAPAQIAKSPESQSVTNFAGNQPENVQSKKTENTETDKVSQGAENGEQEQGKVSQEQEQAESETSQSGAATNFDDSLDKEEMKSEIDEPHDPDIIKERVRRAASDLDETLNLFIIGMPHMESCEDITREYETLNDKIMKLQNVIDMWRQSR